MPFPPALAIANALAYAPPFITKNIERPVRAFRVQVDGIPAVSPTAAPSHAAESTSPIRQAVDRGAAIPEHVAVQVAVRHRGSSSFTYKGRAIAASSGASATCPRSGP